MRHLFLDLEDTIITPVIEGWWKTELINMELIKNIQNIWKPDVISIFSFAVHNQRELDLFNKGTRPLIEDFLGTKLFMVPTTDDNIFPVCCKKHHLAPQLTTFEEINQFWGKQESFRIWIKQTFIKNTHPMGVLFLDDAVENEDIIWRQPNLKVSVRNIDDLNGYFDFHWNI